MHQIHKMDLQITDIFLIPLVLYVPLVASELSEELWLRVMYVILLFTESTVIKIVGEAFIVVPPQWNNISPPIPVRGVAETPFALRAFGGGSLFGFSSATESVRYSPDEVQLLFKVSPGPFSRFVTYDWQPSWVSQGTIPVSGIAETPRVKAFTGFGSLFGINGAAEAVSFNPPDITTDIKLSGVLHRKTYRSLCRNR